MKKFYFILFITIISNLNIGCTASKSLNRSTHEIRDPYVSDNLGMVADSKTFKDNVYANELPLNIVTEPIYPVIRNSTISQFSTKFDSQKTARGHNIKRGSILIDQAIIMPGEIFSFNQNVGPTTKANGFKLGRIFVNGKDSKGYGGGICQVSSTLYNAVLNAGLEIIEVHRHSKPVYYVDQGKDAATSYGVKDFKFRNILPYPIKINSYIYQNVITIAIEYA